MWGGGVEGKNSFSERRTISLFGLIERANTVASRDVFPRKRNIVSGGKEIPSGKSSVAGLLGGGEGGKRSSPVGLWDDEESDEVIIPNSDDMVMNWRR